MELELADANLNDFIKACKDTAVEMFGKTGLSTNDIVFVGVRCIFMNDNRDTLKVGILHKDFVPDDE